MEQCGGVCTGMAALASPPVVDPSCNVNRQYLPHVLAMGHNQHWYVIVTIVHGVGGHVQYIWQGL